MTIGTPQSGRGSHGCAELVIVMFVLITIALGVDILRTWIWPKPTADQLFGCDWANTDLPSGECK